MERFRPTKKQKRGGDYFPASGDALQFIPSGCSLLDCVIGGGWPLGRVSNIVGDKSAGKTLLAIEACANFAREYPKGLLFYRESEAAFDVGYAGRLGLPVDRMDFGPDGIGTPWETVEDVFEDMDKCLTLADKKGQPAIYIIDSLDALSDRDELKRKLDAGSYGTAKAKLMSRLFRQHIRRIQSGKFHLLVVSQIRDKIGVMFGEKTGRMGGKALDFYASQVVWLHHMKTLVETVRGVKRAVGIRVKAKCKKNKIALPFRECEFRIRFGYGIDDIEAAVDWLEEVKMLDLLKITAAKKNSYLDEVAELSQADFIARTQEVRDVVFEAWASIEERFVPERRKYAA